MTTGKRVLGLPSLIGVFALVLAAGFLLSPGTARADGKFYWGGNGVPVTTQCDKDNPADSMLWIFNVGNGSSITAATLSVKGDTYTGTPSGNNNLKFVTPYYDVSTLVSGPNGNVFVSYTGTLSGNTVLTISHGCPGVVQGAALGVNKNAAGSYDNTYTWTIDKSADTDTVYSAGGGESGPVTYTVEVSHDNGTVSNVQVNGTITVFNPNDANLTLASIADTLDGTTCTVDTSGGLTIPSGTASNPGTKNYPYTCSLSGLPAGDVFNNVRITWADQTTNNVHLAAGENAFTTDAVVFTANNIDECVNVSDPADASSPRTFCVGGDGEVDNTFTFTYSQTFNDENGTCTPHENTATFTTNDTGASNSDSVTVTDCQGAELEVSKNATPAFNRTYEWTIDKSADNEVVYTVGGDPATVNYTVSVGHDAGTDSGWTVTGTITVSNPNDWQAITADITDEVDNGGTCTVTGGEDVVIPANDSVELDYTCTYAAAPSPSAGTNKAIAKWDAAAAHTEHGTATGKADFAFGDPTSLTDDCVTVDDTNTNGPQDQEICVDDANPTTFEYSATVDGEAGTCTDYDNTASFITDDTEATDSDTVTVTDCQGADLTVSKTAAPAFDRTYAWTIDKSADKTYVEQTSGTVTFTYTIAVSHNAGTDGNWTVSGTITVTNPNDWQDITADVTDAVNNGGTCTVTDGVGVVIPKSDSKTLNYTCTYASAPSPSAGTNTATATWDATTAYTPSGSANGTADFDFASATPNSIDECVTVVDDKATPGNTADDITLGTACVGDANPKTFTYSLTVNVPAATTCVEYTNTAKFTTNDTGTTNSDSQTVKVCNFQSPLTPGYWKNHLGPNAACKNLSLPSGTGCSPNGPWGNQYFANLKLGNYSVDSIQKAAAVFAGMNCSSTTNQGAVGCLAGHLLASKFNVANGANGCISGTIAQADAFLASINYTGPGGTYTLTTAQRAQAIALKDALDKYNNGGGC